ncbi:MAG: hypothetical protein JWO12_660 [Frankiales bacterium]|nr:hypothetical protein [Frankiales bacterium]
MTALVEIAHCRAGDKGGDSLLVVVPHDPDDLERLATALNPAVLAPHFDMKDEDVSVALAPGPGALVVTLRGRLGGGVTRALGIDPHGKTLSGHLLALDIPWT